MYVPSTPTGETLVFIRIHSRDAALYLPTDIITTEDGSLKPPPPVSCYFGPFDRQILVELKMLEAHSMSALFMPLFRTR